VTPFIKIIVMMIMTMTMIKIMSGATDSLSMLSDAISVSEDRLKLRSLKLEGGWVMPSTLPTCL
jgi:hypothetical protein